jgi:hypothetical protein
MEKAEKQFLLSLSDARDWLQRYHRALRCQTGPGRAACKRILERLLAPSDAASGQTAAIDGIREQIEATLRDCEERIRNNRARRDEIVRGFPELETIFRALDQGNLPPRARWMVLSDDLPFKPFGDFYLMRSDFSTEELLIFEEVIALQRVLIELLEEHSAKTKLLRAVFARTGVKPSGGEQREFTFDLEGNLVQREEKPAAASGMVRRRGAGRRHAQTLARIREVCTVASLGLTMPAACYQLTRKRVPLPSRRLQAAFEGDWHAWMQADPRAFRRFWQHCLANGEPDRT